MESPYGLPTHLTVRRYEPWFEADLAAVRPVLWRAAETLTPLGSGAFDAALRDNGWRGAMAGGSVALSFAKRKLPVLVIKHYGWEFVPEWLWELRIHVTEARRLDVASAELCRTLYVLGGDRATSAYFLTKR